MSINVSGNILSYTGFTPSGEITNTPNIVTDGLLLWYDSGNNASYNNSSTYYDCGYGCQYYGSNPGCTNCNTQIKDMSGYGYDGTLSGATISYTGGTGGSMYFNGSSDYIVVPNTPMDTSFNYSVSVWFKKRSSTNSKFLIAKDNTGTYIQYGLYWGADNVFQFCHSYGNQTEVRAYYSSFDANVIDTNWHNVVALWNGSNIVIYGDTTAGTPVTATTGYAYTDANRHSIGRYGGYNGWYFDGEIAVVLLYNKALSASEIIQNFNADRSRFGV